MVKNCGRGLYTRLELRRPAWALAGNATLQASSRLFKMNSANTLFHLFSPLCCLISSLFNRPALFLTSAVSQCTSSHFFMGRKPSLGTRAPTDQGYRLAGGRDQQLDMRAKDSFQHLGRHSRRFSRLYLIKYKF